MSGKVERIGWAVRVEDGLWSDSKGWNVPWPQMMDQETAEFVARSWREDTDDEDRDDARAILLYADPEGTIESLEAERDELRATVERYREALEEIRDHTWNEYQNRGDHPYSTGVTDGHRCCTNIACRALHPEEEA